MFKHSGFIEISKIGKWVLNLQTIKLKIANFIYASFDKKDFMLNFIFKPI